MSELGNVSVPQLKTKNQELVYDPLNTKIQRPDEIRLDAA
ncbi:hypothetical protein Lepto7375DRAFT_1366 [Leptolyngbya sp. PCC 7375]|nr:hypothetical protein Lepto7375DRAFT_1366 [Leptolyngbya sp. PCC 7375]